MSQAAPPSIGASAAHQSGEPVVASKAGGGVWPAVVMWGVLCAAFIALFREGISTQFRWALERPSDWGHVLMTPLISGYILYQNRRALAEAMKEARPYWPGLAPLSLAIAAYPFIAVGVRNGMMSGWAALLGIFSLVLLMLGPGVMRVAFLPIAYLIFAVPISEKIMLFVTSALQRIAADGSFAVMRSIGLNADIQGNILTVFTSDGTAVPLTIAEACSGLRMLVAFIALGAAVALVACRHWWQRVVLLAFAVPVALLMNMLRVVVLAIASLWNPHLAEGEAHMFIGTLLLIPGFLMYMLILWVLTRVVHETEASPAAKAAVKAASKDRAGTGDRWSLPAWGSMRHPVYITTLSLLAVSALAFNAAIAALEITLRKRPIEPPAGRVLTAISEETASWRRLGKDRIESAAVAEELGTQNYLNRTYVGKEGTGAAGMPPLDVHLAYYTGKIDTVPHVPERCMVGAGWSMEGDPRVVPLGLDASRWTKGEGAGSFRCRTPGYPYSDFPSQPINLPRDADKIELRVTPFVDQGGRMKHYSGYFFVGNGGWTSSAEGVRLLAFDLTSEYAYYLKIQVSSSGVGSAEELARCAASLLDELLPEIMRCVPDWELVQSGEYPADNPRRAVRGTNRP